MPHRWPDSRKTGGVRLIAAVRDLTDCIAHLVLTDRRGDGHGFDIKAILHGLSKFGRPNDFHISKSVLDALRRLMAMATGEPDLVGDGPAALFCVATGRSMQQVTPVFGPAVKRASE